MVCAQNPCCFFSNYNQYSVSIFSGKCSPLSYLIVINIIKNDQIKNSWADCIYLFIYGTLILDLARDCAPQKCSIRLLFIYFTIYQTRVLYYAITKITNWNSQNNCRAETQKSSEKREKDEAPLQKKRKNIYLYFSDRPLRQEGKKGTVRGYQKSKKKKEKREIKIVFQHTRTNQ